VIEQIQGLLQNQVFVGIGGASIMAGLMWFLRSIPHKCSSYFLAWFTVTLETSNDDDTFYWLVRWLAAHPYSQRTRRLALATPISGDYDRPRLVSQTEDANRPRFLLSPAPGVHLLWFRGRPILITRTKEEKAKESFKRPETLHVRAIGRSRAGLCAMIEEAYALSNERKKDQLVVYTYQFNCWQESVRGTKRPFDSVVLAGDVAERIAGDAENFTTKEGWYADRGIPWRRGYLWYGAPGCGKSSFAAALASRMNHSVCMLNLSAIASDEDLINAMRSQPEKSILLVEDVDAGFVERKGERETRITFSAFLNAIDGIAAPTGRILVMTTNHREKLDAALIRPGRIDMQIEFGLATEEQAARIFLRFFPGREREASMFGEQAKGIAPSRIQEMLVSAGDCPEAAVRSLLKAA
jgi:mitochondrial chaperone BCS1